jgi:hypothetical protein
LGFGLQALGRVDVVKRNRRLPIGQRLEICQVN